MGNPSESPSIGDLLNGMKQLTQSGDFRLSPSAAEQELGAIGRFRTALQVHRDKAADLTNYGNPGGFVSATRAKEKLKSAVDDANNGIVPNLNGYLTYLDEYEKAVNAALTRFQAEDNS